MKKLCLSLLAITLSASCLAADDNRGPDRRMQHLSEALNLSEEQQVQVQDIFSQQKQNTKQQLSAVLTVDQMSKLESMKKGPHGKKNGPEQRISQLTEALNLNDSQQQQIKAIFSDSKQQHDEQRAKNKENYSATLIQISSYLDSDQKQQLNNMKKPLKNIDKLNLSSEQKSNIDAILLSAKQQRELGKENRKANHENIQQQISAILNPEQQAQFATMQQERQERREKHCKHKHEKAA